MASVILGDVVTGEPTTLVPEGTPEYFMEVLSVVDYGDRVSVVTTGGEFEFGPRDVTLVRRIDPSVNDVAPRTVGRIRFGRPIGPIRLGAVTKRSCVLTGGSVSFDVRSDSLMFVRNTGAGDLEYTYESLIKDAPWSFGKGPRRMWADGNGGSLHLGIPGQRIRVSETTRDTLTVTLPSGSGSAMSVFPPRKFDFEKLYGRNARPHCYFSTNVQGIERDLGFLDELARRGFGVIVLFTGHYEGDAKTATGAPVKRWFYNEATERVEYRFKNPARTQQLIKAAHDKGFRVITYFKGATFKASAYAPPDPRAADKALAFMREFRNKYGLDGWYFDNANIGNWLKTYDFIRALRTEIGDSGVMYHHDSTDVWGKFNGVVCVPVDSYIDYTLKGEVGELSFVHSPNDPYFAYYTGGYGLSQSIANHKLHIRGRASLAEVDVMRVLAQNLNGSHRLSRPPKWRKRPPWSEWDEYVGPYYLARKKLYLSGELTPGMEWPVNWFRAALNVRTAVLDATTVHVSWVTPKPTDGRVLYTTVESGDFRRHKPVVQHRLTEHHEVILRDLRPGRTYTFAVRSEWGDKPEERLVWGHVGTFTTRAEGAGAGP